MAEITFNESQLDAVALVLFSMLKDESGKPGQSFGSLHKNVHWNHEILLKCKELSIDVPEEMYKLIGRPIGTPLPGTPSIKKGS